MKILNKYLKIIFFILSATYCFGQSDLRIECYPTYALSNGFYLNDTLLIEYGCCGNTPSIYLGVADDTCGWWDNDTDLGNYNGPSVCRVRTERYFIYHQNDPNQLNALDSVINQVIPDNHAFFLYTPASYDHASIQSICPDLAQTFVDQWGPSIDTADMIILFGIKGFPQSYDLMVGSSGDTLIYNHIVCPDCSSQTPVADFFASETVVDIQNSGEVLFTDNSLNADSTIINFGDGNSATLTDSISHVYSSTGTFQSQLIAYNSECSDTMSITITVINTAGISQSSSPDYNMQLFPNPTNGEFNLRFDIGPKGICSVYDSTGKVILSLLLTGETNYNVSEITPGVYTVVVKYDSGLTELTRLVVR